MGSGAREHPGSFPAPPWVGSGRPAGGNLRGGSGGGRGLVSCGGWVARFGLDQTGRLRVECRGWIG